MSTIWRDNPRADRREPRTPPDPPGPGPRSPRGRVGRLAAVVLALLPARHAPVPRPIAMAFPGPPPSALCPICLDDRQCPACEQAYQRRLSQPLPMHELAARVLETLGYPDLVGQAHTAQLLAARAQLPLEQAKQALGWLVEHQFITCRCVDGLAYFAE
ncbi:MAG TPA: hypothetical protein VNL35_00605 [Chloroflexota bacterium]|nr:hypothetical protein [Chloroflexota bacterium]